MHGCNVNYACHVCCWDFAEYYYDIDFIFCAGQEEVQERNKILYESYCHLVRA